MNKLTSILALVFLASFSASAQTPNPWGYNTGYGAVYGTFGLAQTMQSMYNVARAQSRNRTAGKSAVKRSNAVNAQPVGTGSPATTLAAAPSRVVRNYGLYRTDTTVDTGTPLADALGETADEKALIKSIYIATKTAYEKEAAAKGWANNVAGGLTFFTIAAVAVYRDVEEPDEKAIAACFEVMNAALDETPEFAAVENKSKQGFDNMLIGFTGILVGSYLEAKQNNDAVALANSKKLAGMLIQMVLKTDPDNIRIENGQVVMK